MQGYGARVIRGGNQDAMLRKMIAEERYFPCTILWPLAGYSNPFGVEGFKTIAFEICEQLGWSAPDRVFVPVGSGDGIYGIWKGFRELAERGRIESTPRVIACQAAGADSLFRAWMANRRQIDPLETISTEALSVGEFETGGHALRAVYESDGAVLIASEAEIIAASRTLQKNGLAMELASALAFACAEKAAATAGDDESWVVIGSGSAVKWPANLMKNYHRPPLLDPNLEILEFSS
jgi:threonine synthase